MKPLVVFIMVLVFFGAAPSVRAEDPLGKLAGIEGVGKPIPDTELGSMRGKGFGGIAVRILFDAYVDSQGNVNSNLEVEDGNPDASPSISTGLGTGDVKLLAQIGDFNDASGIFQITQVPGSGNNVTNNLYIQIAIINVLNGADPASVSMPGLTGGLFGGP